MQRDEINAVSSAEAEPTPLCPRCLAEIDAQRYYCVCGEATGVMTQYIPYVNIRFNYSIFGELWRRLFLAGEPWLSRVFYTLMLIYFAPVVFVGLAFKLRDRWRSDGEAVSSG